LTTKIRIPEASRVVNDYFFANFGPTDKITGILAKSPLVFDGPAAKSRIRSPEIPPEIPEQAGQVGSQDRSISKEPPIQLFKVNSPILQNCWIPKYMRQEQATRRTCLKRIPMEMAHMKPTFSS
jgi:hypothetical protein